MRTPITNLSTSMVPDAEAMSLRLFPFRFEPSEVEETYQDDYFEKSIVQVRAVLDN
jgi:hypothetical protein